MNTQMIVLLNIAAAVLFAVTNYGLRATSRRALAALAAGVLVTAVAVRIDFSAQLPGGGLIHLHLMGGRRFCSMSPLPSHMAPAVL